MFQIYKKLISYASEKKHLLYFTVFLSVLSAVLQVTAYYYLYEFLKTLIVEGSGELASQRGLFVALLFFIGGVSYFCSLLISHLFAFRLETNLRKHGIDGLSNASFSYYDKHTSGMTRKLIDDNAAQTHMAVAHLIPDNTGATIMPLLILIVSFMISWRVGLVLAVLSVISLFLLKAMMGEIEFMKIYQASLERMSSETVEYIRGMQIVKIFGVDVRSFKALNEAIKTYAKYSYQYSQSCRRPYVLFQELFFALLAIIIPLIILFIDLAAHPLQLVIELIMLFFLSGVLFSFIMKVMYLSMHMFMAKDAVDKLEKIYDEMQRDSLSFGSVTDFSSYDIEFDNVSFGYTDKMILDQLSFKLEGGKSYALVGASGSGKSTIAKLISGFYKVNGGTLRIGGVSLLDYSKEAVIKNIAFVFQDAKLFKKSIYENVRVADRQATREEVLEAMRLAGCDGIISKFKDRENTIIGSKGVYLSGGEKQRIAIARAILKKANIVIFDEASAAVDPENEHELQKAFANLMKGRTVIMIAHRLSSIKNLDEILVLDKGRIIERGSDAELMEKNGIYKKLQELYGKANDWRVIDERVF